MSSHERHSLEDKTTHKKVSRLYNTHTSEKDNSFTGKYYPRRNFEQQNFGFKGTRYLDRDNAYPHNHSYKFNTSPHRQPNLNRSKKFDFIDTASTSSQKLEILQRKKEKIEILKKRQKYELMYEAFHIANLFYQMNESTLLDEVGNMNSGGQHDSNVEYYILSTRWFERWKNYVNFDYYMQNTDKFLKLNKVEPDSEIMEGNFLQELDLPIKNAVENYFQNYFLTDNSQLYPGSVSNKELLYDKGVYYMDLYEKKDYTNYNVMDYFQMGRDYFIVNKPIWNYFGSIYGGKEIKRYLVEKSNNNNSSVVNNSEEYLVETKLKNISLCIIRFKKDEIKFKEKPKFVFFPHQKTVYDFKKHLHKIFSFLKDSLMRDIRLWLLDSSYTFDSFQEYFVNNYKNNTNANKYGENINFPGICLDLLDSNMHIEEINALISNKIIVLEYIDNLNFKNFMFRQQYWSDLPISLKESFKADRIYEGDEPEDRLIKKRTEYISDLSADGVYDTIIINKHDTNDESRNNLSVLFMIKKFFLMKYDLVKIDWVKDKDEAIFGENFEEISNRIYYSKNNIKDNSEDLFYNYYVSPNRDDILKSLIDEEFLKETNFLRENLYLIMDKNEVMQKFSYAYLNSDRFLHKINNNENESRQEKKENRVKSRQELIMKKRERAKLTSTRTSQKYISISNEVVEENQEIFSTINGVISVEDNSGIDNCIQEDRLNDYDENITNQEIAIEISDKGDSSSIKLEEKCNYCDKLIEEIEFVTCEKCMQSKYCNSQCRNKDNRFHSKFCM